LPRQLARRRPGAIDPLKEAEAAEKRLSIPLTTLEGEIAEYNGGDAMEVLEQRGREVKKADAEGLVPPDPTKAPPPQDTPPAKDGTDTETALALRENTAASLRVAEAVAHQPAPVVKIEKGAIQVTVQPAQTNFAQGAIDARTTVHPAEVHVAPAENHVDARTTIAAGAVQVNSPVTVSTAAQGARKLVLDAAGNPIATMPLPDVKE
jgi:hypothetical protein